MTDEKETSPDVLIPEIMPLGYARSDREKSAGGTSTAGAKAVRIALQAEIRRQEMIRLQERARQEMIRQAEHSLQDKIRQMEEAERYPEASVNSVAGPSLMDRWKTDVREKITHSATKAMNSLFDAFDEASNQVAQLPHMDKVQATINTGMDRTFTAIDRAFTAIRNIFSDDDDPSPPGGGNPPPPSGDPAPA
jgi:hypothetical protein